METIRNYLEAMFAPLPDNEEVRRAKDELLEMMEDKYNELIADGVSENSAVGTVISEFGNLDELADDLGLKEEVEINKIRESENPKRQLTFEEVKGYLASEKQSAFFVAFGVFLCIISVCGPIVQEFLWGDKEVIGTLTMFICIGVAVGLFVFNGVTHSQWQFVKKEPCRIDMGSMDYVKEKKRGFVTQRALMLTVGVVLCVICWLPTALLDTYGMGDFGGAFLFIFIATGVYMIVYSGIIEGSFDTLLNLNETGTMGGRYNDIRYTNKKVEAVMEVYWATVTCIYLIWSFVTFDWHYTWIIWPIAGIVYKIIKINYAEEQ